ncbi:DUF1642 domain-containing protein [Lactococcus lactis]|uniref:DUF1642 domain-containing protein n=1 Tax=Lactococcus lactis TaxID=1358 RepID=UPI0021A5389F|nr:DUF1642 domain-containing protein [Lactococcus lactis]MCT3085972.1 DUF1642 domain-containing protein [Lactococcus lactis]MCT3123517.1 DUF1642 domain-containing protein [Lactococcus lactis]
MTKEMKRPISNITQDSIKPLLSNAVEFYTNKNREAHKCIQERDEYINYLESKLSNAKQQQALPVVPECVADAIAWDEQIDNSIAETLKDIFTANDKDLQEAGLWVKNNPEKYIIARNIGYTVEKPQLFYLREKNTGHYLRKTGNNEYEITPHYSNDYDEKYMHYKFTQQEIDSMETGSYEQIEVVE